MRWDPRRAARDADTAKLTPDPRADDHRRMPRRCQNASPPLVLRDPRPLGTLLLHNPRLKRCVVNNSDDPVSRESTEFLPGDPRISLNGLVGIPGALRRLARRHRQRPGNGMIHHAPARCAEDLFGSDQDPAPLRTTRGTPRSRTPRSRNTPRSFLGADQRFFFAHPSDLAMRDDPDQGLRDRRFFETYLDEWIERSRRYGTLFIFFLDLDDLKMVNNFYGHLSGSRTLQPSGQAHPRGGASCPLRRRRILRHAPPNRPGTSRRPCTTASPAPCPATNPPHRRQRRSLHHRQLQ